MIAWKSLALISFLPVAALGQGPTDSAPKAVEANQKAEAPQPGGRVIKPQKPSRLQDGSLDLNRAAQTLEGEETEESEATEATTPPEGTATAAAPGESVPPPDTYTVRSGDTLWDLSGRFLNNPWYWPKVWSYNPEINNPHWIYPGNTLRFYPSTGEAAPTRVEPVAEGPVQAPKELEDLSRGTIDKVEQLGDDDTVAVVGPYKIGYVPPKSVNVRHDSFVTQRELEESGVISASFEEKLMLSNTDKAYAQFKNRAPVKVGQTYAIYKTDGEVVHPFTKELFGYKSSIIGSAKVVAIDDKAVTLVITACYDPIERGHYLAPWSDKLLKRVPKRPNTRALRGFIVASQNEMINEIGEHHVVFVDKGRADGVEEGNTFSVIRSGDPYGQPPSAPLVDPDFPKEVIGDLLIIDAKEHASAALVSRSLRELFVGDRVEMRTASAKGAVSR